MTSTAVHPSAISLPEAPPIPGLAFRTGRLPDDWAPLAAVISAVRLADGIAEVATAGYLSAEWGNLEGWDGGDVLVAEVDGRMVGFATGHTRHRDGALVIDTWCGVLPEVRRRGLGTALHRWARQHFRDRTDGHPDAAARHFRTWALEQEVGDVALFEHEGFVPIRYGFEMRQFLTGTLPVHPVPEGLEIRPVRDDDLRTILEGEDEAFRITGATTR